MNVLKVIVLGSALSLMLPAHAEPDFEKQFKRLDANRDGQLDWSEAYPKRVTDFTALDKNLNGDVEESEFRDRIIPFTQFDANSDGKLALSEYVGTHRAMFAKADTTGDGTVNLQEFISAQKSIRGQ